MTEPTKKSSEILAYTVTYGDRREVLSRMKAMRATSGVWYDWVVYAGAPSEELSSQLKKGLVEKTFQYLLEWPVNKGQHHATKEALALAKEKGYKWLVRIDDDVQPKTKKWLKTILEYMETLKENVGDPIYRLVGGPKVLGLLYPIKPEKFLNTGPQDFLAEVVPLLGGAVRVHNVEFFKNYEPDLTSPLGRGDPQGVAEYLEDNQGFFVRFPGVRVVHHTKTLESKDTAEQKVARRMGMYWPYIEGEDQKSAD